MIHAGFPLPERPTLAEALDRGYDPHAPTHHHVTPEPLSDEWQAALDGSAMNAEHRRDDDLNDPSCGERCDSCDDRMCAVYGPEPRACGTTCCDCPCDCTSCVRVRHEMRAEVMAQIQKENGR